MSLNGLPLPDSVTSASARGAVWARLSRDFKGFFEELANALPRQCLFKGEFQKEDLRLTLRCCTYVS